MSAAEITALRQLLGLPVSELAWILDNDERAVRRRESGKNPVITEGVAAEMWELVEEHNQLVADYAAQEVVLLPVDGDDYRPRGWFIAAAGRALALNPDLEIQWEENSGT